MNQLRLVSHKNACPRGHIDLDDSIDISAWSKILRNIPPSCQWQAWRVTALIDTQAHSPDTALLLTAPGDTTRTISGQLSTSLYWQASRTYAARLMQAHIWLSLGCLGNSCPHCVFWGCLCCTCESSVTCIQRLPCNLPRSLCQQNEAVHICLWGCEIRLERRALQASGRFARW